MPEIRGILCDLDGTLVNSEWVHVLAWNVIGEKYKLVLEEGWDADYVGKPDAYQAEKMRQMFPQLPEESALLVERHAIYQDLLRKHAEQIRFPGVLDEVKNALDAGYLLAVGSNSVLPNCTTALDAAGLSAYFPVVVAYGQVKEGKPAPDIYLEAARRLGLSPAECVVLEDTEIGLVAGKAAGCRTVGVTTTHMSEDLTSADRVFSKTADAFAWIRGEGREVLAS